MSDYIKREDAENIMLGSCDESALWKVRRLPTADAVEVVRCENCRYSKPNVGGSDTLVICERLIEPMKWFLDDYCSYGERKDNE